MPTTRVLPSQVGIAARGSWGSGSLFPLQDSPIPPAAQGPVVTVVPASVPVLSNAAGNVSAESDGSAVVMRGSRNLEYL